MKCTAQMGGPSPACPGQNQRNPGLQLRPLSQPHLRKNCERAYQNPPAHTGLTRFIYSCISIAIQHCCSSLLFCIATPCPVQAILLSIYMYVQLCCIVSRCPACQGILCCSPFVVHDRYKLAWLLRPWWHRDSRYSPSCTCLSY